MYRVLGVKVGTAIITAAGIGAYSSIEAAGLKPVYGCAKQKKLPIKEMCFNRKFSSGAIFLRHCP